MPDSTGDIAILCQIRNTTGQAEFRTVRTRRFAQKIPIDPQGHTASISTQLTTPRGHRPKKLLTHEA